VNDSTIPIERLAALEAFKELISDPDGRREYAEADDKQAVFDAHTTGADYEQLPEQTREVLEDLDDTELTLLVRLDSAFVEGGLGLPLPSGIRNAMVF
jgi:hypothetical protein